MKPRQSNLFSFLAIKKRLNPKHNTGGSEDQVLIGWRGGDQKEGQTSRPLSTEIREELNKQFRFESKYPDYILFNTLSVSYCKNIFIYLFF